MKMFLFSADEDTLTGLRLAGVEGVLIDSADALNENAQSVMQRGDIAILLVTRSLSLQYPQEILQLKKNQSLLVTEIPDMMHLTTESDSITRYVRDAIGISV